MAQKKYDADLDDELSKWTDVGRKEFPIAFDAWKSYRREELGCRFVPEAYTVPSLMPPITDREKQDYAKMIHRIRASIGWTGTSAKVPGL